MKPNSSLRHISALALGAIVITAFACGSSNANTTATPPERTNTPTDTTAAAPTKFQGVTPEASAWADSVMKTLTPRQRIAQLFVPRLDITNNAAGYQKVHQMLGLNKMGGMLLGKGSLQAYADLNNRAQKEATVPALITLDGEWGPAMRVHEAPRFPYNMALGATRNEQLMYEYGREVARECKLLGIQVDFAPVLDVNSNPDNPVIGYRSFGEDPEMVGRLGSAYCHGLMEGGVLPTGKHFPGHGDTSTDSHKTLPTVGHSLAQLKAVGMKPFEICIADGWMPGVMVGHLRVPALDAKGTPASLSKTITTDWLQDSLGFNGLIFTDALAMKGAVNASENNCVSALLAGADILLGSTAPETDLTAVEAAVKAGKIKQADIDRRCKKVLEYKYLLGINKKPVVDINGLKAKLNTPEVANLIRRMANESVTLIKNTDKLLPIKAAADSSTVAIVSIGQPADNTFSNECGKSGKVEKYSVTSAAALSTATLGKIKQADVVVIAVFSDAAWAKTAFKQLAACKQAVGVFFVNPYKMAKFQGIDSLKSLVESYDDIPATRTAAAQAIYGKIPFLGTLPVNLKGVAKMGTGIKTK